MASVWFIFMNGLEVTTLNWSLPVTSAPLSRFIFRFSAAMLGISGLKVQLEFTVKSGQFSKRFVISWANC
jgi:hypothetical protein